MDQQLVEKLFSDIITEGLGLDINDPNLCDTPKRVAKMYCQELFSSVGEDFNDFKSFPNEDPVCDEIVMLDNIEFSSTCSHHFLPFEGVAWVLYLPDKLLIGASKAARLIEHYARRPQIQERLAHQVLHAFVEGVKPKGAMVVMRATHGCMRCRGVRQRGDAGLTNSAIYGEFHNDSVKNEGLKLIEFSRRK